jgi:quercetin dioxygenase-like cupin family protein
MRSQPRVIPGLRAQAGEAMGAPLGARVATVVGSVLLFGARAIALCVLGFFTVLSLGAQEPVPLARGNTPGEPHHHLKIENEYVRVYYVDVPPHENTQLHQHDHDYIYVSLGPSDVVNAIVNKPEIHLQLKDGETHFTRGGFAHVARNLADTPFRNITIELLKPQGEAHNLCERIVDAPLGTCIQLPQGKPPVSFAATPWLETDRVRLVSTSLAAKAGYQQFAKFDMLFVVVNDSVLRVDLAGAPSKILHTGEALWLPRGMSAHVAGPLEGTASRYVVLFFKD